MREADGELSAFRKWLVREHLASPLTVDYYTTDVTQALAAGDIADGAATLLGKRSYAPQTRRRKLAALRAYATFTENGELRAQLERLAKKLPPNERKIVKEPLSSDDWKALRKAIETDEAIDEPLRAVLGIMAVRGLRVGDVLRLRPEDVEEALKTGVLHALGKKSRQLEFGVLAAYEGYLETLNAEDGWKHVRDLISAKGRRGAAEKRVNFNLKRVAERAGLSSEALTAHRLRRTTIVAFYEETLDLEAARQFACHANVNTTQRYLDHSRRAKVDQVASQILK